MTYDTIESTKKPITLLLKGPSGSGKTWKAAHFPKPVYFNFDNNLRSLQNLPEAIRKEIRIVNLRTRTKDDKQVEVEMTKVYDYFWERLEQVLDDDSVETVIIDSITMLADFLMYKLVGTANPSKQAEIQHFGAYVRHFNHLGDMILTNSALDKHVILIAHEQTVIDSKNQTTNLTLSLMTKVKDDFGRFFTDEWRAYRKHVGSKTQFRINTSGGYNFSAKCSLNLPGDFEWEAEVSNILKQL